MAQHTPEERPAVTSTGEGLFHRIRTGEWPVLKIDLSEAYANVRKRANTLRRRRIISGVIAGVMLAGLGTVSGSYLLNEIPLPSQLTLPATTTVYYSDGTTVLARLGSQLRTVVSPSTLPSYVGQAVVAAEDPQFWVTSGTLISRQYARAAVVSSGGSVDGPTDQAKVLVLVWKLEDTYSKDDILGFYLNTVYFGRGAYGIEAAAQAYFGIPAAQLSLEQAIVLAGLISSPGDGRFDPTVDLGAATSRFAAVAQSMVTMRTIDQAAASRLALPPVEPFDPTKSISDLDTPAGFIVAQVLAELRALPVFQDHPAAYLVDGGFSIVTTIDAGLQKILERTIDRDTTGSLLAAQPREIAAAAVVVQPGTGRVLAYYGGQDGTGADYAGTRATAEGGLAGFGYHPPGETMSVYTLAAAVQAGISTASVWQAKSTRQYPAHGHTAVNPVRDVQSAPCQPECTLAEAILVPLNIPFYSVVDRIGPAAVLDTARAAGIGAAWSIDDGAPVRHDLTDPGATAALTPDPFGADVALGAYPVTVLDQASAMATFAAGGRRAATHFVAQVTRSYAAVYEESTQTTQAIDAGVVADVTAALAAQPDALVSPGLPSAGVPGTVLVDPLRNTRDTLHAWFVGYTPTVGVAVWVGSRDDEQPLVDSTQTPIRGDGLPAQAYRLIVLGETTLAGQPSGSFPAPAGLGDPAAGELPPRPDEEPL